MLPKLTFRRQAALLPTQMADEIGVDRKTLQHWVRRRKMELELQHETYPDVALVCVEEALAGGEILRGYDSVGAASSDAGKA